MEKKVPVRSEVPVEMTWQLEDIYPSAEDFEKEFVQIGELVKTFAGMEGAAAKSGASLLKAYDLLEKIDRIQLGEKTDMGIEDYTDLIVFEYPDGTTKQYRFEADVYVEDDKNRYLVLSGLQDVRSILNAMVEGKQ